MAPCGGTRSVKAKERLVAGSHEVSRRDCRSDSSTTRACAVRGGSSAPAAAGGAADDAETKPPGLLDDVLPAPLGLAIATYSAHSAALS